MTGRKVVNHIQNETGRDGTKQMKRENGHPGEQKKTWSNHMGMGGGGKLRRLVFHTSMLRSALKTTEQRGTRYLARREGTTGRAHSKQTKKAVVRERSGGSAPHARGKN